MHQGSSLAWKRQRQGCPSLRANLGHLYGTGAILVTFLWILSKRQIATGYLFSLSVSQNMILKMENKKHESALHLPCIHRLSRWWSFGLPWQELLKLPTSTLLGIPSHVTDSPEEDGEPPAAVRSERLAHLFQPTLCQGHGLQGPPSDLHCYGNKALKGFS